jgi:hypothetical protein
MDRGLLVCMAGALIACDATSAEPNPAEPSSIGFASLSADSYRVQEAELASGEARCFYTFRPTTADDQAAPLFVVTTGGPGAPVVLLADQLNELSTVGHTLFIDARNSGFSYVLDDDVESLTARQSRLGAAEYNVFRDAADVASVLLDFFQQYPEHARREVYFVAESYGGARTAVLLDLFLSASKYSTTPGPFLSPSLRDRIEAHLIHRFGELPVAEGAARGFRGQILLQPIIAGQLQDEEAGRLFEEPNSILDVLAESSGVRYVRCAEQTTACNPFANAQAFLEAIGVSRYDYRAPVGWLDTLLDGAARTAGDPEALADTLGVSPSAIVDALSERPPKAFRFGEVVACAPTALDEALPPVATWDAYFVALHPQLPAVFRGAAARELDVHPDSTVLPGLFVSNLRHTTTFITRAEYDLHVYAPALPGVLARMPGVAAVSSNDAAETLSVTLDDGTVRTVHAPHFAASHAIGHDDPEQLVAAIATLVAAH